MKTLCGTLVSGIPRQTRLMALFLCIVVPSGHARGQIIVKDEESIAFLGNSITRRVGNASMATFASPSGVSQPRASRSPQSRRAARLGETPRRRRKNATPRGTARAETGPADDAQGLTMKPPASFSTPTCWCRLCYFTQGRFRGRGPAGTFCYQYGSIVGISRHYHAADGGFGLWENNGGRAAGRAVGLVLPRGRHAAPRLENDHSPRELETFGPLADCNFTVIPSTWSRP